MNSRIGSGRQTTPSSRSPRRIVLSAGLALAASTVALAGISSFGGDVLVLTTPPTSVAEGALESDDFIHAFEEQQDVTLAAPITLDVTAPGTYGATLTPGAIAAGTVVSSFLVHADQVGTSGSTPFSGTLTFDDPIIGVILSDAQLDASDSAVGLGITYPSGVTYRGIDTTLGDVIVVDGRTIDIAISVSTVLDQFRVITGNRLAFSVDIGSDVEYMDAVADGNEVLDSGNVYLSGGLAGATVTWSDFLAFPEAVFQEPYGYVMCPPPGPLNVFHWQNFDCDGFDTLGFPLESLLPGPLYEDDLAAFDTAGIHPAKSLVISFDDDIDWSWVQWCILTTPTESPSPAGATYGLGADEVLEATLDTSGAYPWSVLSLTGLANETDVHPDLAPLPTTEAEDDDVDALDWLTNASYRYFSADSEGAGAWMAPGMNPAIVYRGGYVTHVPVVGPVGLGIPAGTDVDAFEFAWLPSDPTVASSPLALALLFSVDDDDPQTTDYFESGGLNPYHVYASFLDGTHFLFATFDDDVDAIAVLPHGVITREAENYCTPAVPNSTGGPAEITASGSFSTVANALVLEASGMPANQFGYFLVSETAGFVANPGGSQGNLCLGGAIGRYTAGIFNSGATGVGQLAPDLANTPTPSGMVAIQAGETWNFTAWYRDVNPMPTSNFTDAVAVTFH